jgi:hypothetical protein
MADLGTLLQAFTLRVNTRLRSLDACYRAQPGKRFNKETRLYDADPQRLPVNQRQADSCKQPVPWGGGVGLVHLNQLLAHQAVSATKIFFKKIGQRYLPEKRLAVA